MDQIREFEKVLEMLNKKEKSEKKKIMPHNHFKIKKYNQNLITKKITDIFVIRWDEMLVQLGKLRFQIENKRTDHNKKSLEIQKINIRKNYFYNQRLCWYIYKNKQIKHGPFQVTQTKPESMMKWN